MTAPPIARRADPPPEPAPPPPQPVAAAPAGYDEHPPEPPPKPPSVLRLVLIAVGVLVVVAALAVAGFALRNRRDAERERTDEDRRTAVPRVLVATAAAAPETVVQQLPGSAAGWQETAVYARTTGYLRTRLADIGDPVTAGQELAEVESPEVDAQVAQARAAVAEAQGTLARNEAAAVRAKADLERLTGVAKAAASQQEIDAATAADKAAAATVRGSGASIVAAQANVKRLEDLQAFQRVRAPFAGVVTARNYDVGALVVADSAAARELFHIARVDTVRVFVDVPQVYASFVHEGLAADVYRSERAGEMHPGRVTRSAKAIDPLTRTLRTEVDVPNRPAADLPAGVDPLLPGMYLQVRFTLQSNTTVVRVPGAAVITRAEGNKVAVVDADHRLRYRAVKLGRDFGKEVEVVAGLAAGETVAVRPGDDLPDGTRVDPAAPSDR